MSLVEQINENIRNLKVKDNLVCLNDNFECLIPVYVIMCALYSVAFSK